MKQNESLGCIGPALGGMTVCALIFNWFGIGTFVTGTTGNLLGNLAGRTKTSNSSRDVQTFATEKKIDLRLVGSWQQDVPNPMWCISLGPQGAGWYLVYVRHGGDVITERGSNWYVDGTTVVCDNHTGVKTVKPPNGLEWSEPVNGQKYRFPYQHTGNATVRIQDGNRKPIDLRLSR